MKTNLLTIIIFLLFPCTIFAQKTMTGADSARVVVDSMINFAQKKSIYRGQVNWKVLTDSVHKVSDKANSVKQVMPAVQLIYKLLGDFHGFVTYQKKYYKWRRKEAPLDSAKYKSMFTKMKGIPAIETRIFNENYGYLLLPANNPTHRGDSEKLCQQLQDSLTRLNPAKLKGLIIDLRTNSGGSMYPMILGLGNLLGEGKLGSFIDPVTKQEEAWGIRGNAIYSGKETELTSAVPLAFNTKLKIVVLIGPNTASSGEATAITFKGRKYTMFIGEDSEGYTTANDSFRIFDLNVFMATAVEADRNGNVYLDKVSPDQEIKGLDNFEDLTKDAKVIAALKWLK